MSYKYHERAMVTNTRNMVRLWDICYDGYNGGKDDRVVDWSKEAPGADRPFNNATTDMSVPYTGPSLMVSTCGTCLGWCRLSGCRCLRVWPSCTPSPCTAGICPWARS